MKDKVAIITGGTSGFGKGTAELLAAKGVKVVLSARRKEVGEQIASDIRALAERRSSQSPTSTMKPASKLSSLRRSRTMAASIWQ